MTCKICGNHEKETDCMKCNFCQKEHFMKYGKNWLIGKENGDLGKPCPHICRFQLPNKEWITYKCQKHLKHSGSCNFGVNVKTVERIARDTSGR